MKNLLSMVSAACTAIVAAGAMSLVPAHAAAVSTDCAGLQAALTGGNGNVITLHDTGLCTNGPFTLPNNVSLTLQGLTQADGFDGNGTTILSGGPVGNVVIQNLTFQNGVGGTGAAINIFNSPNGQVTLSHSLFFNNGGNNGGFSNIDLDVQSANPMVITGNVIGSPGRGNHSNFGAAVLAQTDGPITFSGNQVLDNTTTQDGSGALLSELGSSSSVTVDGNVFARNSSTGGDGGGLRIFNNGTGANNLTANTFSDNVLGAVSTSSPKNHGGGLFVQARHAGATVVQAHNLFARNIVHVASLSQGTAFDFGGGGEFFQSPLLTSTDDTFVNNHVDGGDPDNTAVGGGLALQGQPVPGEVPTGIASVLHAYNMVVANNSVGAGGVGGGVYTGFPSSCTHGQVCPGVAEIFDSTITANSVGAGGGASGIGGDDTDTAHVVNSIVNGNTGNQKQINGQGTITVDHTDACQDATAPYPGAGNICKDAVLANAAGNDVHQTAASPTIDRGDSSQVPSALTQDYEGDTREVGSAVDMGADEFVPTLPTAGAPLATPSAPWLPAGLGLLGLAVVTTTAVRSRRRRRRGLRV
jgi:hypothetical protein